MQGDPENFTFFYKCKYIEQIYIYVYICKYIYMYILYIYVLILKIRAGVGVLGFAGKRLGKRNKKQN